MTDKPLRVEWTGRADRVMAEVAEALGVTTSTIMAVYQRDALRYTALFSPDVDDDDPHIWMALLKRRRNGVLKVVQRRRTKDRWSDIERRVEQGVRGTLGDP